MLGEMMKKAAFGLTALAVALVVNPATAEPTKADLWIGLEGSQDGFLLDTKTGEVWMTGICLKPLKTAEKSGRKWTTRVTEFVSVGRAMAMLDQTFTLDTAPGNPSFTVDNPQRGAAQTFPAKLLDCGAKADCSQLAAQPVCED